MSSGLLLIVLLILKIEIGVSYCIIMIITGLSEVADALTVRHLHIANPI